MTSEDLSRYEQDMLKRLVEKQGDTGWKSSVELCATPDALKKLARLGYATREHDGRRWRYRATEKGRAEAAL